MRYLAIIQARLGSTRLPGKVMLDLCGKPVLQRVIERVLKSEFLKESVLIASTVSESDSKIAQFCCGLGIPVFRGSEDDVLDRFYQSAKRMKAENIVRITADCPLIDYRVIDQVIRLHEKSGSDYTANVLKHTFPDGQDTEVFKFSALEKAWKEAALKSEREHVTPYIWKNTSLFSHANLEAAENYGDMRWTLDNQSDFELISAVYSHFLPDEFFSMEKIIDFLCKNPELSSLNMGNRRNEGYEKSLKNDQS